MFFPVVPGNLSSSVLLAALASFRLWAEITGIRTDDLAVVSPALRQGCNCCNRSQLM